MLTLSRDGGAVKALSQPQAPRVWVVNFKKCVTPCRTARGAVWIEIHARRKIGKLVRYRGFRRPFTKGALKESALRVYQLFSLTRKNRIDAVYFAAKTINNPLDLRELQTD